MLVTIETIESDRFPLYGRIPNWYEVKSILQAQPVAGGLGGFTLEEEELREPFIRDYNSHREDNPIHWEGRFDLSTWGVFLATDEYEQPVGGATVAVGASVYPIDRYQRSDLAVLWDIRVHPDHRRRGIGSQLLTYGAEWAREQGYGRLGIETDSSNVGACRFYMNQGCELGAIHRFGYSGVPRVAEYAMLLWYVDL